MNNIKIERFNNIEYLRLLFALQVMFVHAFQHIKEIEISIINSLPGVPAFFFISGFLIYASYIKSKNIKDYFVNRVLRLVPGLIFVTLAGFIVVLYAKGFVFLLQNIKFFVIWFVAQLTLGQAYNPSLFRDIGVGTINGSLWTITVEILFYISVPVIVFFERYYRHTVLLFLVLSLIFYIFGSQVLDFELTRGKTMFEFIKLTPIVWGWMFLVGVLCFKYYSILYRYKYYLKWSILPLIVIFLFDGSGWLFNYNGNSLGVLYYLFYVLFIFYIAFGAKYIPLRFDISYGVYVWHMVVINLLLVINIKSVLLVFFLTISFAFVSWFFVEKPSLKLKKYSLRRD
ncbi:MAG: acyltransferase [Candidatus Pacearchaeota archaeon]|nr:acyltransferase [Candidatus Pacearchaeota archaeon]